MRHEHLLVSGQQVASDIRQTDPLVLVIDFLAYGILFLEEKNKEKIFFVKFAARSMTREKGKKL